MPKTLAKTHDYLEEMVCPITHELPVNPVVAEDGRVYELKAWTKYVRSTDLRNLRLSRHGLRRRYLREYIVRLH